MSGLRYVALERRFAAPYASASDRVWIVLDLASGRLKDVAVPFDELPARLGSRGDLDAELDCDAVHRAVTEALCGRYVWTGRKRFAMTQAQRLPDPPASTSDIVEWLNAGHDGSTRRRHPSAGDRGAVRVRRDARGEIEIFAELRRLFPTYRQPRSAYLPLIEAGHVIENLVLRSAADGTRYEVTLQHRLQENMELEIARARRHGTVAQVTRNVRPIHHCQPILVAMEGRWHRCTGASSLEPMSSLELASASAQLIDGATCETATGKIIGELADNGWFGAYVAWLSHEGQVDALDTTPELGLSREALDTMTARRRTTRAFAPTRLPPSDIADLLADAQIHDLQVMVHLANTTPEWAGLLGLQYTIMAPHALVLVAHDSRRLSTALVTLGRAAQRLCLLAADRGIGIWPIHPQDDGALRSRLGIDGTGPMYFLAVGVGAGEGSMPTEALR